MASRGAYDEVFEPLPRPPAPLFPVDLGNDVFGIAVGLLPVWVPVDQPGFDALPKFLS